MNNFCSIIIPTYNDSIERLKKTINSVLLQTFQNFEIIVVDDCSRQPLGVGDKELQNQKIKWLTLKKNKGVAGARNAGLKMAKGMYIAFLDAGDWWEPENLKKKITCFEKGSNRLCMVISGRTIYRQYGKPFVNVPQQSDNWVKTLLVGNPGIAPCCVLIKKSYLDIVGGFYEKEDIPEDKDLWLRLALIGDFELLPESLVCYESIISNSRSLLFPEKKKKTYKRYLELHHDKLIEYGVEKQAWGYYHRAISIKYFRSQLIRRGLKHSFMSLKLSWDTRFFLQSLIAALSVLTPFSYEQISTEIGSRFLKLFFREYH